MNTLQKWLILAAVWSLCQILVIGKQLFINISDETPERRQFAVCKQWHTQTHMHVGCSKWISVSSVHPEFSDPAGSSNFESSRYGRIRNQTGSANISPDPDLDSMHPNWFVSGSYRIYWFKITGYSRIRKFWMRCISCKCKTKCTCFICL